MDREKLGQVMEAARSGADGGGHVGIRNLHKRLDLYYRGMASLRIDSAPGEGTTVEFRIPLKLLSVEEGEVI
jgi:two-component system sensor histidine kinase YesM